MQSLKEKIDSLKNDRFLVDIVNSSRCTIHDVVNQNNHTCVIWSDNRGYSVSYSGYNCQGTGGCFKTIIGAVKELENRFHD